MGARRMSAATQTTEPCQVFHAWREAVDAAAALRAPLVNRRVQMLRRPWQGEDHVPSAGVIKDVIASGFKVRWDHSGVVETCHPDLVVFI